MVGGNWKVVQGGQGVTLSRVTFCDHHDQTGRNLCQFVADFEGDFPECKTDWKLCVTKLRKLTQYTGDLWDNLIADRASIAAPSGPAAAKYSAVLEEKNEVNATVPASPNGDTVADWKHILTGIDAANFPKISDTWDLQSGLGTAQVLNGPATATWSGDVGSALGEFNMSKTGTRAKPLTDKDGVQQTGSRDFFWRSFAGDDDMLGDMDGLAMADERMPDSEPFSRRLCRYYCGAGDPTVWVKLRFHRMCRIQGATLSSNQLDSKSKKDMRTQILAFAQAWQIKNANKNGQAAIQDDDLDWYTNKFIDWVNKGLTNEGDPGSWPPPPAPTGAPTS
jgi:hypothetical protein